MAGAGGLLKDFLSPPPPYSVLILDLGQGREARPLFLLHKEIPSHYAREVVICMLGIYHIRNKS